MSRIPKVLPTLLIGALSFGQTSQPSDLRALEKNVTQQFNELRERAGLKPPKARSDRRMRMEACSIQIKGLNPIVDIAQQKFAATAQYPSGSYWVVVYTEHSAAHEALWSHFYLTEDFEYQTPFGKHWRQGLPQQCRSIQ